MTDLSYWQPRQFAGIGHHDALWNAILTHAGSDIAIGNGARAIFAPGTRPGDDALCTRLRVHDRQAGDAPLALYIVWRDFPFALFGADIATDDLQALPRALRDALIRGMTDMLADALWPRDPSAVAPPGRPERVSILANTALGDIAGSLPDDTSWFDVTIDGFAGGSAAIGVGISRAALLASAGKQGILPARVFEEARALITLSATFTLGSASFPARELARIRKGTVIVLPRSDNKRRMLRVDKTILEFHAKGDAWILAGRRHGAPRPDRHLFRKRDVTDQTRADDADQPQANDPTAGEAAAPPASPVALGPGDATAMAGAGPDTPPETDGSSPADDGPARDASPADPGVVWEGADAPAPEGFRLADLAITVDFDIGEKDFTLAEIETWQAGAVVALEPPPLAGRVEVTLRVNGQAIATGDLIAIDDRLAVRLSRLLLGS